MVGSALKRMTSHWSAAPLIVLVVFVGLSISGCGGGDPVTTAPAGEFPEGGSRSLQEMADLAEGQLNLVAASSVYPPGNTRFAFALFDDQQRAVDRPSAVYFAARGEDKAQGPFPATFDSLEPDPPFRSATASTDDPRSVYTSSLPIKKSGGYQILVLTKDGKGWDAGIIALPVKPRAGIPTVGSAAPRISTPTLESVKGVQSKIDTRRPFDSMHNTDFKSVVGKKPIALVFATPQLCTSRVCGPVTDVAAQLQAKYGDRVAFIHNEIYENNDANGDYLPQLKAFGLRTEPWVFTFDKQGRVAARIEGAIGVEEFDKAVQAALKQPTTG